MAARRRVVLTQVIARHGDRAPAANLTHSNKEHDRWHQRLPSAEELQVRCHYVDRLAMYVITHSNAID